MNRPLLVTPRVLVMLGAFVTSAALIACGGPKPPACSPVAERWTPARSATPTSAAGSAQPAPSVSATP